MRPRAEGQLGSERHIFKNVSVNIRLPLQHVFFVRLFLLLLLATPAQKILPFAPLSGETLECVECLALPFPSIRSAAYLTKLLLAFSLIQTFLSYNSLSTEWQVQKIKEGVLLAGVKSISSKLFSFSVLVCYIYALLTLY